MISEIRVRHLHEGGFASGAEEGGDDVPEDLKNGLRCLVQFHGSMCVLNVNK